MEIVFEGCRALAKCSSKELVNSTASSFLPFTAHDINTQYDGAAARERERKPSVMREKSSAPKFCFEKEDVRLQKLALSVG
jgi:hypothetical protein